MLLLLLLLLVPLLLSPLRLSPRTRLRGGSVPRMLELLQIEQDPIVL
jgi:hypothetical protein